MTKERDLDAIFQAKIEGMADEQIMKQFSTDLREIERAVVKNTGLNLNLIKTPNRFNGAGPKNFTLESSSVWSFKSRGNWATHNGNYRGNWSPYVPRNVILRYSKPGDLVLDQFCGAGTTAVEAKLLDRNCEARDINPTAVTLARRNLDFTLSIQEKLDDREQDTIYSPNVEVGDARDLSNIANDSVDLICTHPPYANIIQYSDGIEGDLSSCDIDSFLKEMRLVAKECYRTLKPGKICAFLIGDMRRKKRVIPLGFQTIQVFLNQGFILKDLIIKRQHNCRTTGFWYSSSIKYNFLLLSQEYLPVFIKPDTKSDEESFRRTSSLHPLSSMVQKPFTPSEMHCKTTWVLDTGEYESQLESNLFNRYGEFGKILKIEFPNHEAKLDIDIPENTDLIYVKSPSDQYQRKEYLTQFLEYLTNNMSLMNQKIRSGGHLAFRLKDFRDNGMFLCPIISAWQIPLSYFHIREIIIITSEEKTHEEISTDLEINHEYILLYQKD